MKKPESHHITGKNTYTETKKKTDWLLLRSGFSFLMSQLSKIKCMC